MRAFSAIALLATAVLPVLHAENKPQPAPKVRLPDPCTRIRFQPAKGEERALVGGRFSGSNTSRWEGFQLLAEIKDTPQAGKWAELTFNNPKAYRWIRYVGPQGSDGKGPTKIELYAGEKLLAATKERGIDYGSFDTDHAFAGFDLVDAGSARRPHIKPDQLDQDAPLDITMDSSAGAKIFYTLDGSWPDAAHGKAYTGPLHIDKTATISATAQFDGGAPSLPMTVTYLLKGSSQPGLNTAHIGNSLTGTTGGFFRFARTAGIDHKSAAFLRPGALTRELFAVSNGTYAQDKLAKAKEDQALKRGTLSWQDFWAKVGKVDLLTLQPRDFDLDKELAAEVNFIKLFREKSPNLQPWLYCEWVEQKRERPSDKGEVPSYQMKKTFPALTWEESMGAMLLYVEELQHRLDSMHLEGKRPRIIPASLAMGWIRNMIDHGKLPGIKPGSFYPLLFNDQVHPADAPIHGTANGAYLVDMTWFSAFYRQPPEGKVLPIETSFTPEQARIVERLAWDVIKNYPDCGLYEEGTEPCGKPEFKTEGKAITLSSSTPGAWFRYTLDGTEPTRTRGYVYCGVITRQPGIQVTAVAYKSGMKDSEVSSKE